MAEDVEEVFSDRLELLLNRPRIFFFIALRIRPFATRSPSMLAASWSARGQDSIGMRCGNPQPFGSFILNFRYFEHIFLSLQTVDYGVFVKTETSANRVLADKGAFVRLPSASPDCAWPLYPPTKFSITQTEYVPSGM